MRQCTAVLGILRNTKFPYFRILRLIISLPRQTLVTARVFLCLMKSEEIFRCFHPYKDKSTILRKKAASTLCWNSFFGNGWNSFYDFTIFNPLYNKKLHPILSPNNSSNYKIMASSTFSQIYIQIVFAVKGRQSLILSKWEEDLIKYITGIVQNKDQKLLAINGMPDHIHI